MNRTLRLSATLFGLIILLLAGLNYHVHTELREEAIRRETAELERQAQILAQDIGNSLQAIRFKLEQIALQVELGRGDGQAIHHYLSEAEQSLGYVRALAVVDPSGTTIHSSRAYPAPRVSLADRDNIAHHVVTVGSSLFIGGISQNRLDGRWQFSMSLAVRDGDGRLLHVITSVIDPNAYAEAFQQTSAAGDFVTLLDSGFTLIARSPWRDDLVGQALAEAPAYRSYAAAREARHSGQFGNLFTGEARLVAMQSLFDGQLVVSTSRSLEAALQGWRSLARIISAISAAVVLIGAIIAYAAIRLLADRERKAEALRILNRDLMEQTARAERAAAAKSDFLATMSHEIRTPMNGVLGMTQAMAKLPLDDQARDYLTVIRESSESLLSVINDILDFSRLEAGKLKLQAASLRVQPLLDSLGALFAPACTQKGLDFRIEVAPDTPAVIETDHVRLRQVLMNLIGNAVKFTPSGHVLLRAAPVQRNQGGGNIAAIRFEIEDTGIGIAPEAQQHLFQRFSQEDASIARRFGGTGLGLAICKRLCELLGGSIGCRSEKGAGSVFWIELPVMADIEEELPAAHDPLPVAADGRLHVLAVDDNPVNRRIIEALLRPFGHQLAFATGGMEAIRQVEGRPFNVVLLDIHMPEMDGFETLRRLRRLPHGRRARVLALTADVVPESTVRYGEAGFDAVVAKPVVLEDLLAAMAPRQKVA